MERYGKILKDIEIYREYMRIYREYMEIYGTIWKYMEIYGNIQKHIEKQKMYRKQCVDFRLCICFTSRSIAQPNISPQSSQRSKQIIIVSASDTLTTTIFKSTIFLIWFGTFMRRLGWIRHFEINNFASGIFPAGASATFKASK